MERRPGLDKVDHSLIDFIVVVSQCERARTIEEIDVAFAVDVLHPRPLALGEGDREPARIAPRGGLVIGLPADKVLGRVLVH